MNILIVGNGGRENMVCRKLKDTNNNLYYYGTYNNPDMDKYANRLEIGLKNMENIDMVFIGPESYLSDGLVDVLIENGIRCIGPTKSLARIETSKSYARQLMTKYGMQQYCPKYWIYDSWNESIKDILNECEYVIKADGLHSGKGVKVYGEDLLNIDDAINYCNEIFSGCEGLVIEEKLYGEEFSLMSFTDGSTLKHMPIVKDYKRLLDNNLGPNTGSMGSISFANHKLPFLTDEDIKICQNINQSMVKCLYDEIGEKYKGILYGSYMKTRDGEIKVIEFNARFGDPECINVLSILKTDLLSIFRAICDECLDKIDVEFMNMDTCCCYMVPHGYPNNSIKGYNIYIDNDINWDNVLCASITKDERGYYYEIGSRTLAIFGTDIENTINKIHGPLHWRSDIRIMEINYQNAGVNIDEGNKVVGNIRQYVEMTFNNNVVSQFGDFAGMYKLSADSNEILVTSTDGVGTKSILVLEKYGPEIGYQMLGQDLVNHCVNDILVKGAKPLFFLDYYANSKINAEYVKYFVKGISQACCQVGCVLIGGETAEMPDIYMEGKCDIAGMIVGKVDIDKVIDGKIMINQDDIILGLPSSGPHTNGYSLIRKLVDNSTPRDIVEKLCATHRCYYNDIIRMQSEGMEINGMCHLTGGGWIDNPTRVLPNGLKMDVKWEMSEEFKYLMNKGKISYEEMIRTFNCGIGMLVYISSKSIISEEWKPYIIGKVITI